MQNWDTQVYFAFIYVWVCLCVCVSKVVRMNISRLLSCRTDWSQAWDHKYMLVCVCRLSHQKLHKVLPLRISTGNKPPEQSKKREIKCHKNKIMHTYQQTQVVFTSSNISEYWINNFYCLPLCTSDIQHKF